MYRFIYMLMAITATGVFTSNNAQEPGVRQIGGGAGITVFRDRNFRGSAATFTSDVPNLASVGFNNAISSFRVGPGEQWMMCDRPNFAGTCVNVSGQESDLRNNGWDNRASSLRRISGGGGGFPPRPPTNANIVLFDRTSFRGQSNSYDRPTPNLFGAGNRAQSVTVGGGQWQLCDRVNFGGRCITVSRNISNLATVGMRNRIQSLRPMGFNPGPGPFPPPSVGQITLFTQQNYLGMPTTFNRERSNIVKVTRSATVQSGSWQLCDAPNFTGRCIVLNQSVWDLSNYNIGRTIRSIRPN